MPHGTVITTSGGQGEGTAYVYTSEDPGGGQDQKIIWDIDKFPRIGPGHVVSLDDEKVVNGIEERGVGNVNKTGSKLTVTSSNGTCLVGPVSTIDGESHAGQKGVSFANIKGNASYIQSGRS